MPHSACPRAHGYRHLPASASGPCCAAGPRSLGLPLELLAGAAGLDRRITSPHIQKTGLALAGFDAYLQPGRVLIFGESEIRYLESLDSPPARRTRCGAPSPATSRRS